jgi:hypothetical protein
MSVNEFLPFATDPTANVEAQASYSGSGHQTLGFQTGIADSSQINKALRQATVISSALAQVVSDAGNDVHDDGNQTTLISQIKDALSLKKSFANFLIKANYLRVGSIIQVDMAHFYSGGGIDTSVGFSFNGATVYPLGFQIWASGDKRWIRASISITSLGSSGAYSGLVFGRMINASPADICLNVSAAIDTTIDQTVSMDTAFGLTVSGSIVLIQ